MLRNIGQNATGYFFDIALKTISPDIEGTLSDLNSMAQKLNQNNINSCNAGAALAKGAADMIGGDMARTADTMGANVTGSFTDFFDAASNNNSNPSSVQSTLAAAKSADPTLFNDAGNNPVTPTGPFNVLYNALDASGGLIFGGSGLSPEQIDLMISLLGTTIIQPATNSNTAVGIYPIKPSISWDAFIGDQVAGGTQDTALCGGGTAPAATDASGNPINGTSVCMRTCALATGSAPGAEKCIYASDTDGLQLESFTGFSQMTRNSLINIEQAILSRTTLTDLNALGIINISSVPIYSMISTTMSLDAMGGSGSTYLTDQVIDVYADIISIEIAYRFIQSSLTDTDRLTKAFMAKADTHQKALLEPMMDTAKTVLAQASKRYAEVQRATAARVQDLNSTIKFAEILQKNMDGQMLASLKFSPK